jgi:CshA-type fibril repeat protein
LSSTGVGLAAQSVTVAVPTGGSAALLDPSGDETDIGTYAMSAGVIVFRPAPGFVGAAPPRPYRVTDGYGQRADSSYTATVTLPPPPSAPDESSIGRGTTPQSADLVVPAGGSITLLDADGDPVTELVLPGKGTYRLEVLTGSTFATALLRVPAIAAAAVPGTAVVTFTPVLGYQGEAPPVAYQITDSYGQTDAAVYTPTVTLPALPAPPPKTTTGDENDTQRVTVPVPPGGSVTLLDGNGAPATSVTMPGQGTYTLDPATGAIVFVAVDGFTGTPDAVTYRVTDAYGQSADSTYGADVTGGGGQNPALPTTGSPILPIVLLGVLALALGAALVTTARRPRRP